MSRYQFPGGINDEDLLAIAALSGTGYLQRTGANTWELGEVDTGSTIDPVVYPIDLGKTYANLVGNPPSVLEKSWVTWATNLKDRREANCPRAKSQSYYFAANGNDNNDGSLANPWQSLTRANALMSGLAGQKVNSARLTVVDNSAFDIQNRSWWMGAWVLTPASGPYYAPIFTRTDSFGLLIGTVGVGARITPRVMTNGTDHVVWSAPLVADTWQYVEAWFDTTTRSLSISVNNGPPVTETKPTQFPATANALHCGQGGWATGSFPGDMARAFFVRDVVPTNAQRAAMYNSGKGLRSYLLGSLKSVFTANSGSFWDMNGFSGATTYADAISARTFTRSVAQNPVAVPGPDTDAAVTSTNGVVSGGGDFAVLFRRGDKFTGKFNCARGNVTVADYETGTKPIISDFSVPITNTWTLVAGTTWKRACSPVGWVKKVGDDVYPFSLVLFKEVSALAVQSRANSFFYDVGAGELHLNVGANPATVSPTGWEGTVRGSITPNQASGDAQRIENLIILGSGITEAGNPSGYGLQITGTLNQEHVCKGLEVFFTGYHALGHISTKSIGTWIDCKAGLCASRNEAGLVSYSADGTVYVSFCGNGDQEMVMWQCETNHGPLPSYDTQGGNNFAGYISHTSGVELPSLNLIYECGFTATDFPVAEAYTMGQAAITGWEQSRCWVYGGYVEGNYTSHFQIGIGLFCTYVNQNAGIRYGNIPGRLLDGLQGIWLANSTITADAASLGTSALNLFQTSAVARLVNCRIDVINSGAGGVRIANGALGAGTLFENTIFTISTTGSVTLGDATSGQFDQCAFRGWTGVGTSPVNLSVTPLIDSSTNAWQLYGTGKSGLIEYDADGRARRLTPSIGPFELTADDQTDANSFSTAAFVNAAVAGKQNTLSLTTTGSSGAATLVGSTLNIPQYSGGGGLGTFTKAQLDTAVSDGNVLYVGDAPTAHNHSATEITSGTMDPVRLGSGASITTKFLRGDSTWQTISGGGDALVASNLDQFADVTQTGGATLSITSSTTLSGGTHSGTNTGDNAVNSLYSGLVSNATHTGDVTGATELTIANGAVTIAKTTGIQKAITSGTAAPSGGVDGDIYLQYT